MMGKGSNASAPTKFTGINVQTSAQGICIAMCWGQVRLGPNLIWYNNFIAQPVKQGKGGKGGGKGATSYNYSAAVIMALCEGPITSVGKVWTDQDTTTLAKLGLTLFLGSAGQAPWSYVVSKYPSQARAYAYTAYVANSNYKLGQSPVLPNHNFEVTTPLSGSMPGTVDVNLGDVIPDFLNNVQYGIGPCGLDSDSLAFFKTYCQAQGLFFSPLLQSQEQVSQVLDRWAGLTNSWIFWSGAALKFVPLGDQAITANGTTYTPITTSALDLTPSDFVASQGTPPITVTRADLADCPNHVKLQVKDRANNYNTASVEWQDFGLTSQYGRVDSSISQANEVCDLAVANTIVQLVGQREANNRNQYAFNLNSALGSIVEPGDLVSVYEPSVNINTPRLVRVISLDEDQNGNWAVVAEQFVPRMGTATIGAAQSASNITINTNVDPGNVNPPGVFEPPSTLTQGIQMIWVMVSGGADWGGAGAYISFDDVNYDIIGFTSEPSLQGTLTAGLPSHVDPDNTNTLHIDLIESDGVLETTATHADAVALRTLFMICPAYVGTTIPYAAEVMAYGAVAQGVDPNKFDLTDLRRGQYGTTPTSHALGDFFTRIDITAGQVNQSLLQYPLPTSYIGGPIYLKFVSLNRFMKGLQDISTVTAYVYTPTGMAAPASITIELDVLSLNLISTPPVVGLGLILICPPPPTDPTLLCEFQILPPGATTWLDYMGAANQDQVITGILTAIGTYGIRVRYISTTGNIFSQWLTTTYDLPAGDVVWIEESTTYVPVVDNDVDNIIATVF